METEKQKICKEREHHNFSNEDGSMDLDKVQFAMDNFSEAVINLTCRDCGMGAELRGNFEDE